MKKEDFILVIYHDKDLYPYQTFYETFEEAKETANSFDNIGNIREMFIVDKNSTDFHYIIKP